MSRTLNLSNGSNIHWISFFDYCSKENIFSYKDSRYDILTAIAYKLKDYNGRFIASSNGIEKQIDGIIFREDEDLLVFKLTFN